MSSGDKLFLLIKGAPWLNAMDWSLLLWRDDNLPPGFRALSNKVIYVVGKNLGKWKAIDSAVIPVPMIAIFFGDDIS